MDFPIQFGNFYLLDKLGSGGMAEVFVAIGDNIEDKFEFHALKRILPQYSLNKDFINMLIDEAKISSLLTHPNIVELHDLGTVGVDFYLLLEIIHGKSLKDFLIKSKKISTELAVFIFNEIESALTYAHNLKDKFGRSLNIVHKDVNPANIIISYDGDVKLTDFGIATSKLTHLSQSSTSLGKLPYMAPECLRKEALDSKTDVYSLGMILFEMLNGTLPFSNESIIDLQQQILTAEPSKINPDIPNEFEFIIKKALRKNKIDRWENVEAMKNEINKIFTFSRIGKDKTKKNLAEQMRALFSKEIEDEKLRLRYSLNQIIENKTKKISNINSKKSPIVKKLDETITLSEEEMQEIAKEEKKEEFTAQYDLNQTKNTKNILKTILYFILIMLVIFILFFYFKR
jgi:serine/threonine protein kinase